MRVKQLLLLFVLVSSFVVAKVAVSEEHFLQQGALSLSGDLQLAPGKSLKDGVILVTHGGLAHRDMEMIRHLRALLMDRGYNTFAMNLSLGINNRRGMYDCSHPHRHTNEQVMQELALWLNWLHDQGAEDVILLGHSRGGAQISRFAARHVRDGYSAVVLLTPSTADNAGRGYQQRYQQPLKPVLDRAQRLVEKGQGTSIIEHANMMFCRDTKVSAESFVSNYGQDDLLDAPGLIAEIMQPTLVIVASDDEVVIGLEDKLKQINNRSNLTVNTVDGAGHFFRDLNGEDAADLIDDYLSQLH